MIYFNSADTQVKRCSAMHPPIYRRLHHCTNTGARDAIAPKLHLIAPIALRGLNSTFTAICSRLANCTFLRNCTPKKWCNLTFKNPGSAIALKLKAFNLNNQ